MYTEEDSSSSLKLYVFDITTAEEGNYTCVLSSQQSSTTYTLNWQLLLVSEYGTLKLFFDITCPCKDLMFVMKSVRLDIITEDYGCTWCMVGQM